MPSVAVIGHSNLPKFASWSNNIQLETFKVKGAKLIDLIQRKNFPETSYTTSWDYVILFMGGNDIAKCRDIDTLFRRFLTAKELFPCERFILTDIEPRVYTPEKAARYRIRTEQYTAVAKVVNKKLKRYASREKPIVQMVHIPPSYTINSHDGIHLTASGTQKLIGRYKAIIDAHSNAQKVSLRREANSA